MVRFKMMITSDKFAVIKCFSEWAINSPEELELVPADVGLLRGKGWRNKWRSSKGSGSGGGRDRGSGGGGGEEAEAAGSGGGVRPGNAVLF